MRIARLRKCFMSWLIACAGFCAHAQTPSLELVVLGSGGPGATGRAGSSYAVLIDGEPRIVVDAGPGAFVRWGEAKLALAKADIVLLTHLHADHAGGLPGLVKARAVSTRGEIVFNVFGPAGARGGQGDARFPSTSQFVDLLFGKQGAFSYLRDFAAPVSFKVRNIDTTLASAATTKIIFTQGDLSITAVAGHHRDAPAVIYRIDYRGRSVTFSGDIDPAGHAALKTIARDTDLLVFNAVVRDPPHSPAALYALHTTPHDIGMIASSAKAKALLLSHLSPATEGARDEVGGSIQSVYMGALQFAEDGLRVKP
jgi:ribonuclease BN (tRNA processing enzyme)